MASQPTPKVDPRTAAEIAQQVKQLLAQYVPTWKDASDPIGGAIVSIFARFAEAIVQRLNQVPDKNFLAFLNLLGASQLPPQPARAPLTFSPVAGSAIDGLVPIGTQVAAPPAEGEQEPAIFETERELVVTTASLESVFVRDSALDRYADCSGIAQPNSSLSLPVFQGDRPIEHIFYLGHSQLLGFPLIQQLNLTLTLSSNTLLQDERSWQWELWDGKEWQALTPASDSTQNLRRSGAIAFEHIQAIPTTLVDSIESRWLRCRLVTPIALADKPLNGPLNGMVRAAQLPSINAVSVQASLERTGLAIAAALANSVPVDLTKPFFPFGERPKFGDTLYLAHPEAFSQRGAKITLQVKLVNPADAGITATPDLAKLKLQWEWWDGNAWIVLGTSTKDGKTSGSPAGFADNTKAFTATPGNDPLTVTFALPSDRQPVATTIEGIESFWIRVRIVAGDYGKEATYVQVTPAPTPVPTPTTTLATTPATTPAPPAYAYQPATFAPPSIASLTVDYELTTPASPPEQIVTHNDFVTTLIPNGSSFQPFQPTADSRPTFYLGFTLPPNRTSFPNLPISFYCQTYGLKYGERTVPLSQEQNQQLGDPGSTVGHQFWLTNAEKKTITFQLAILGTQWPTTAPTAIALEAGKTIAPSVQVVIPTGTPVGNSDRGFIVLTRADDPSFMQSAAFETFVGREFPSGDRLQVTWQYWNGTDWVRLTVRDDSENFTRAGLVEILPPSDFAPKSEFGLPDRYWLRAVWESGEYAIAPQLNRVALNTTMAAQTVTIRNEILGSSTGTERQQFRTTRSPVLAGQQLEVRELELPTAGERAKLQAEEGEDAIAFSLDSAGHPAEVWVRWHAVVDFYASKPRDRHYTINPLSGTIQFGDGLNGLIPPIGTSNLRMARYQTGGGATGNRPAGAIAQLNTTIPYVDKVTNLEPASGGANIETMDDLKERAPHIIRHRFRAVTAEDYEDLALLASPEVVRARCVPLRDLAVDPTDETIVPGAVSVIIVPRSLEAKPLPSLELIERVRAYLETHSTPTAKVSVVGPLYVQVSVTVEIALTSLEGASAVEQAVSQILTRFLHPLTGGFDGTGWDFGREPHRSDFFALLEAVPGVDCVRTLEIDDGTEYPPGAKQTGRFLVYAGQHRLNLVFGLNF